MCLAGGLNAFLSVAELVTRGELRSEMANGKDQRPSSLALPCLVWSSGLAPSRSVVVLAGEFILVFFLEM